MAVARHECSHPGCVATLNPTSGDILPPGWTMARVEEHRHNHVEHYYLYLCPLHKIMTTERQISLFPEMER